MSRPSWKTGKPTVFFSHSSKDAVVLARLKEAFLAKTGSSIDLFLSSDGQSIRLGHNWVHRVEEALDEAKLMFLFVTPNSLRSNWLHFEAGYAYSRKVRVIPIGFLGVDLTALAPPLTLLQGRNIVSEAGFNNLIAEVNDEFDFSHLESFSRDDYVRICGLHVPVGATSALAQFTEGVRFDPPTYTAEYLRAHRDGAIDVGKEIEEFVAQLDVPHHVAREEHWVGGDEKWSKNGRIKSIDLFGAWVMFDWQQRPFTLRADFSANALMLDMAERLFRAFTNLSLRGSEYTLQFRANVYRLEGVKLTARLDPERFTLLGDGWYRCGDIAFSVRAQHPDNGTHYYQNALTFRFLSDTLDGQKLDEIASYLIEREVIFLGNDLAPGSFGHMRIGRSSDDGNPNY